MFIKKNNNPKNKKTGDCVIRAIAEALDKDWITVFDELTIIARQKYTVPTDKLAYEEYLKDYNTIPAINNYRERWSIDDLQCMSDKKTYIVSIAGHLACIKNGNLIDTWDCGKKKAYKIWVIK